MAFKKQTTQRTHAQAHTPKKKSHRRKKNCQKKAVDAQQKQPKLPPIPSFSYTLQKSHFLWTPKLINTTHHEGIHNIHEMPAGLPKPKKAVAAPISKKHNRPATTTTKQSDVVTPLPLHRVGSAKVASSEGIVANTTGGLTRISGRGAQAAATSSEVKRGLTVSDVSPYAVRDVAKQKAQPKKVKTDVHIDALAGLRGRRKSRCPDLTLDEEEQKGRDWIDTLDQQDLGGLGVCNTYA